MSRLSRLSRLYRLSTLSRLGFLLCAEDADSFSIQKRESVSLLYAQRRQTSLYRKERVSLFDPWTRQTSSLVYM